MTFCVHQENRDCWIHVNEWNQADCVKLVQSIISPYSRSLHFHLEEQFYKSMIVARLKCLHVYIFFILAKVSLTVSGSWDFVSPPLKQRKIQHVLLFPTIFLLLRLTLFSKNKQKRYWKAYSPQEMFVTADNILWFRIWLFL